MLMKEWSRRFEGRRVKLVAKQGKSSDSPKLWRACKAARHQLRREFTGGRSSV